MNHGFNKDNLISLGAAYVNDNMEFVKPFDNSYPQFIEEISQNSDIINAAGCVLGPITGS